MPGDALHEAVAVNANDLTASGQYTNIESTTTSSSTAFDNNTISVTQATVPTMVKVDHENVDAVPVGNIFLSSPEQSHPVPATSTSAAQKLPMSSILISTVIDSLLTSQNAPSQRFTQDLSTTNRPSTTIDNSISHTSEKTNIVIQPPPSKIKPDPLIGTKTNAATAISQHVFPPGKNFAAHSIPTLSTGTSSNDSIFRPSRYHLSFKSGSITLPSPYPTTMSLSSNQPPFPTTIEQLLTNDHSQYHINGQTLTSGGMIVVSGTTVYPAGNNTQLSVGTSKGPPMPSLLPSSASSPPGSIVQPFSGNASGARDELWSSSTILLLGLVVLKWL